MFIYGVYWIVPLPFGRALRWWRPFSRVTERTSGNYWCKSFWFIDPKAGRTVGSAVPYSPSSSPIDRFIDPKFDPITHTYLLSRYLSTYLGIFYSLLVSHGWCIYLQKPIPFTLPWPITQTTPSRTTLWRALTRHFSPLTSCLSPCVGEEPSHQTAMDRFSLLWTLRSPLIDRISVEGKKAEWQVIW